LTSAVSNRVGAWIQEGAHVDFLDGVSAQHLLGQHGYAAIFVIVMLESAGIPMPGETILVSAAVYAGTRHALDIRWVAAGLHRGERASQHGKPPIELRASRSRTPR
jgi:hypothetical protein